MTRVCKRAAGPNWMKSAALVAAGARDDALAAFMGDIVKFAQSTVSELDAKLKDVRIPRANLGPCPICGRDVIENRKGYSCWSKDDPGCGFVIWKKKANKILPPAVVKELMATYKTEKPVTGFRGRSGRMFSAKLKLEQGEDGKWRVEFDEEWARQKGFRVEAAQVDGASPVQVYRRIYLPLMAPALAAVGTYALLLAWNEYLYQFLLLSSDQSMTVPVALARFLNCPRRIRLSE